LYLQLGGILTLLEFIITNQLIDSCIFCINVLCEMEIRFSSAAAKPLKYSLPILLG